MGKIPRYRRLVQTEPYASTVENNASARWSQRSLPCTAQNAASNQNGAEGQSGQRGQSSRT